MTPVVLAMPGNERSADELARVIGAERGSATIRRFPDGESYVRIESSVQDRRVLVVCTLDRPDAKLVPLLLLAAAAHDNAALDVGLVAPYLPYMRQDRRFHPGETISARHVANWISSAFDWIVTVDPHLHRIERLSQVYPIPTRVVHSAPAVAAWLRENVRQPLLVGPDSESEQWVADIANRIDAPFVVLQKTRRGDREVEVSVPDIGRWRGHTPVLVDDIVSTARTMVAALEHLRAAGAPAPVCVVVHAIFAGEALLELRLAGAADVVSCDTVPHLSNRIPLTGAIAEQIRLLFESGISRSSVDESRVNDNQEETR
ncbi:MAG: ribose-phosphate pyrophosphokinase [Burkholderiaceae bacterium]|nr:ribose-phosphate pyrophosphokinase [Burkholderiaceae bacterium]